MKAPESLSNLSPNDLQRQRGSTLTLFALCLVVIFLTLGVVVDLGTGYVARARMSKAIDAGVLNAARYTSRGEKEMERMALKVAMANYARSSAVNYAVTITSPQIDTQRVRMTGSSSTPTRFAALLGMASLDIATTSEATRYPLDMSLSLDLSASLDRNGAFKPMQNAAVAFLQYFDEGIDQIGVNSYSTWAMENTPVQKYFRIGASKAINKLKSISDTNIQEGLRLAGEQVGLARQREGATKIIVLFTDGRPTAYRDTFEFNANYCGELDAVVGAYISGSSYRGLFAHDSGKKIINFLKPPTGKGNLKAGAAHIGGYHASKTNKKDKRDKDKDDGDSDTDDDSDQDDDSDADDDSDQDDDSDADDDSDQDDDSDADDDSDQGDDGDDEDDDGEDAPLCALKYVSNASSSASPKPKHLGNWGAVNGNNIRAGAIVKAEQMAGSLRAAGYTIYVVGLGNPNATLEGDQPDLEFLKRVANHGGISSLTQPRGELIFAPSTKELDDAFARVAERILTRLTR